MGPYVGAIAARVALGEPSGVDLEPVNPLRAAPSAAVRQPCPADAIDLD
jgi:hypothetical protein